ncbi:pyruvate kinase [Hymenobacter segetis]|uniref:pyruvate kinase n=1 Tax=Hymenobacter segetis TaxID=2025509 RepID=A0ABU9M2F1_9BACT
MAELIRPASVPPRSSADLDGLLAELTTVRDEMVGFATQCTQYLSSIHPNFQLGARNLLHYLALRQRDLRPLQYRLAELGLSSLGRAEAHALASVEAVRAVLHALARPTSPEPVQPDETGPTFSSGPRLLAEHSTACLGPVPAERDVRIMVTMPSEAATNYALVEELLRQGMDCLRINCAHDDVAAWQQMIAHLRRAEQTLGKSCKVSMDLAGPKLRTQGLPPGPAVLQISPKIDAFGRRLAPARIWLSAAEQPTAAPAAAAASLAFPAAWLLGLHAGEAIAFVDARGKRRKLHVGSCTPQGCWAELSKTTYLTPLTQFRGADGMATIQHLEPSEPFILLRPSDSLLVRRRPAGGGALSVPTALDGEAAAAIGCAWSEAFDYVRAGEPIWFDDGKIGGVIEEVEPEALRVRITQARSQGEKLRNDKSINLPESQLPLSALTEKDQRDLAFVAQHADLVALSFVSSAADVEQLRQEISRLTDRELPIILKIETRRGFEQLPALLLSAMQGESCAVMIARGDLAVECGFERLAEVQEEILWLCEAAHVPVIWATQVLESLARGGMPSRAEITDAAMGDRAECVMLNKGPRVVEAVRILSGILRRMQAHQRKKSAMLRGLRVAQAWPGI